MTRKSEEGDRSRGKTGNSNKRAKHLVFRSIGRRTVYRASLPTPPPPFPSLLLSPPSLFPSLIFINWGGRVIESQRMWRKSECEWKERGGGRSKMITSIFGCGIVHKKTIFEIGTRENSHKNCTSDTSIVVEKSKIIIYN